MATSPVTPVLEILRRAAHLQDNPRKTISYLLDLLFYGEFQIFEQVASSRAFDFVNLVGLKGPATKNSDGLWLVSSVSPDSDPIPGSWRSTGGDGTEPRLDAVSGMIRGRGASSGKVDLILKILAASRFARTELKRPLAVMALFGEEARSTGVRSLLEDPTDAPGAALVGGSTNLELWTAHPGCISFRLEVSRNIRHRRMPPTRGIYEVIVPGRSAHVQTRSLGTDALARGLEVLEALRRPGDIRVLVFDAGESADRVPARCQMWVATSYDELPELPPDVSSRAAADGVSLPFPVDSLLDAWLTARSAAIDAVVPLARTDQNPPGAIPRAPVHTGWLATGRDSAAGNLTFWTGPGVDTNEVGSILAEAVQQALVGRGEVSVSIQVTQDRPALAPLSPESKLLASARKRLRSNGIPPVTTHGLVTSDAGLLAAGGAEVLVFGPGRGYADRYRDDEGVPVQHLEACLKFYQAVIADWCLGR